MSDFQKARERFPLKPLLEALSSGAASVDLQGLDLELLAYLAVKLRAQLQSPLILLCPTESEARRLRDDLCFFSNEGVLQIPFIDHSPYGHLSPDRGRVMELMASLSRLAWEEPPFILLSAGALARPVLPQEILLERSTLISVGQSLDRQGLLRSLAGSGYHAVSTVEDPGSFPSSTQSTCASGAVGG